MTLYNLKKDLVDEKNLISEKNLNRMVIRTVLMLLLIGIALGILTSVVLDYRFMLLILVLFSLLFLWIFDYCSEDSGFLNIWFKVSRFWWLGFAVIVGVYVFLHVFGF